MLTLPVAKDLALLGWHKCALKCDQEPAIVKLLRAIRAKRGVDFGLPKEDERVNQLTVLEHSPVVL